MDSNDERCYWVTVTEEGKEAEYIEMFDTKAEAIKAARSLAWDREDNALIVVNDDLGDEHWNNEGDWKNASY